MSDSARVVFVCPTLAVGGAERLLSALAVQLREHRIEATVVALNTAGRFFDELKANGIPVHFAGISSRYDIFGIRCACRIIRAANPDAIVSQSIDAHVISQWVARRSRIPHLAIEHGGPGLPWRFHQRLMARVIGPRIDLAISVTEEQESDLLALGYPASRIRVISNGVPEPKPLRSRSVVRAELGVRDDELLALLVAMLRPEKQGGLFVDAVGVARRSGCPVKGVIAGMGSDLPNVIARAAGVEGISILGERSDVADLMIAADVVCLSSRVEGLPIAILEAMALGRPIVSTAVGGVPEAVGPDAGLLVAPGSADALAEALCVAARNPQTLLAMGRAARDRYVERYSMDRVVDTYAATLRELIDQRKTMGGSHKWRL